MEKNNTSRQIIIKDNSIVICLVMTAVLIAAGLILAKTAVMGDAGSLYADSIQPQMFRFKVETQSAHKVESVTAAADIKPPAQAPEKLSPQVSTKPEPVKAAPAAPMTPKEETAVVVLPKANDPSKTESQPPPQISEPSTAATKPFLRTMRGGRHPQYASIVFEYSGPIDYSSPRIAGEEIRFNIMNITTRLRPYRKYRTFDSWVKLDKTDSGLDVSIGVLPGQYKISDFLMEDPPRLVINLYDKDN
ncbi:MAG: hypothetical protein P1P89_04415 [Desulfobacterales bacterium]|nr:hypothetical protein [Desulfobacterales bacterium]